jgi:hypothetical protein
VEHRLRVFEKRVLRIFGPKRDDVTGSLKILNNEELGQGSCMDGEKRNAYRILVERPEGKRSM